MATAVAVKKPTWKEVKTEDGRSYYYNEETRETRWERPEEMEAAVPNVLPDGWAENRTEDGRVYYYHATTRETSWTRPVSVEPAVKPAAISAATPAATLAATPVATSVAAPVAAPVVSRVEKRPADAMQNGEEWIEYKTPEGRTYYCNQRTKVTSWTKPEGAMGAVSQREQKRLRAAPYVPMNAAHPMRVEHGAKLAAGVAPKAGKPRKTLPKAGRSVRRPRTAEGKALTDKAAEKYFITRAALRKSADDADNVALPTFEDEVDVRGTAGTTGWTEERIAVFETMLRDCNITAQSSWLETMATCTDDKRYQVLPSYGLRKHAWNNYRQKDLHMQRRTAILAERATATAFMELLEECFGSEPADVLTLDACRPTAVRTFQAEQRYRTMSSDENRHALTRAFFSQRQRKAEREREALRKECLSAMRASLDAKIDPAILDVDSTSAGKPTLSDVEAPAAVKNVTDAKDKKTWFTDRTLFRDLEKFLSDQSQFRDVSEEDRAMVIRDWRRDVGRIVMEKRAREKEARRFLERQNRARFRDGVEKMLLDGRLAIGARWRDVAETVCKEDFAQDEQDLGARPSALFEDAHEMFNKRVHTHKDQFKKLVKDADLDITEKTTVEELRKVEALASLISTLQDSIVTALLLDRKRKEEKRRIRAIEDFGDLLRRRDFASDATPESIIELVSARSAYKQLHAMIGDEGMTKIVAESLERRRAKDQKRAKRKMDDMNGPPPMHHNSGLPLGGASADDRAKRPRLGQGHGRIRGEQRPVLLPFGAAAREEESGWAAAVSNKPMTETERAEERERRKREILAGMDSQGSAVKSGPAKPPGASSMAK